MKVLKGGLESRGSGHFGGSTSPPKRGVANPILSTQANLKKIKSDEAKAKKMQEGKRSCAECRRLKAKCDRVFPCSNCKSIHIEVGMRFYPANLICR